MTLEQILKLFPAFNEIKDEAVLEKSLKAMNMAMKKRGWDENNINIYPITLNRKNCDVSWVEHVNDVTKTCMLNFDALEKYYKRHNVKISRDVVIAGALLHDIGKLTEFVCVEGKAVHSENFELMRHPLSGAVIASEADLPDIISYI